MLLELKLPPALLVLLFAGLMYVLAPYLPSMYIVASLKWTLVLVFLLLAVLFCFFGLWEFRKHKTTVDPRIPHKAVALVNSGIYRISRNPMYMGFVFFLFSLLIFLSSPCLIFVIVAFVLYMNRFQIIPEERALKRLFSKQYSQYQAQVRRWL